MEQAHATTHYNHNGSINAASDNGNAADPHHLSSNFAYTSAQTDPFQSFINTEDEAAFDNTWQTPDFPTQQPSTNNEYDPDIQQWQNPQYPPSDANSWAIAQYGAGSQYPSNPPAFQYTGFDPHHQQEFAPRQTIAPATYSGASNFNVPALGHGPPYQYSRPSESDQTSQTISPAAISSYPDIQAPTVTEDGQGLPMQQITGNKSQPQSNVTSLSPLTIQNWRQLANRTVKSIDRPGLHIKPTNQFEAATQTKRFNGYIFVGSTNIAVNSVKATVPKYKRKKSRNEAFRLLQLEKGDGPWSADREHVVKKLKVADRKQGGPKSLIASAQVKGRSSASASSESESDDSSEYYSDSDVEEAEEPSPLPATRPSEPNKAVEYDVLKAIWAKRSTALSGPVIRSALGEVWDIFKDIRDKWKSRCVNLQQAIDKKDASTEKTFERRVAESRRLLEACNATILKHGHPSIVEKLSENPLLLVLYYQFLADRIKFGEHSGPFVTGILEVISRSPNIDSSLLEKTKVDKLLPRILKKGDDGGKKFAQRILDHAKLIDKKAGGSNKVNGTSKKTSSTVKSLNAEDSKKETPEPNRKASGSTAVKNANETNAVRTKALSSDAKIAAKGKTDSPEAKTKVVNVAAKPSGFFSSLKSASKKPGTSTKSDEATASTQDRKPDVAATAPKPAFSFAATMAGLAKQKEEAPSKVEEARGPETEDERRKRLRKESRRRLRVSFKPDDELVATRIFVHDPDEELGHDKSQVRDVLDTRNEGQMLKMHKDLELDDEEDYEPPEEIEPVMPSWAVPQPTDFSDINKEERSRNYVQNGGLKELDPQAKERERQTERESEVLSVVYTSFADVPPSPKEPSDTQASAEGAETSFGQPGEKTMSREKEYYNRRPVQSVPVTPPTPDISALLSMISNSKQPTQNPPVDQPRPIMQQPVESANPLAALFANLQQGQPAYSNQAAVQQPPADQFNLQAALAGMQQQAQPAYMPNAANQANVPVPNLQAILSQINAQGSAAPAPPMQNYGYNGNQPSFMNEDRKRQIESDESEQLRKKPRGGKPFAGTPYLPCRFWQEGKCRKGDDCTFLHDSK